MRHLQSPTMKDMFPWRWNQVQRSHRSSDNSGSYALHTSWLIMRETKSSKGSKVSMKIITKYCNTCRWCYLSFNVQPPNDDCQHQSKEKILIRLMIYYSTYIMSCFKFDKMSKANWGWTQPSYPPPPLKILILCCFQFWLYNMHML